MKRILMMAILSLLGWDLAVAHDPIFSPGPHVLYKDGIEIYIGSRHEKSAQEKKTALGLGLTYGVSANWAVGIEIPYVRAEDATNMSDGLGDVSLSTKYRFWRRDSLGLQESAAVFINRILNNGDEAAIPSLGSGSVDTLLGITYGYESLKWYRWMSLRLRRSNGNAVDHHQGDRWWGDFAMGYRPDPPIYLEPDSVWILELNGEQANYTNTGETQWYISPGIFWTHRNFAIKAGVQLLMAGEMKGLQKKHDYRVKLGFEWHL